MDSSDLLPDADEIATKAPKSTLYYIKKNQEWSIYFIIFRKIEVIMQTLGLWFPDDVHPCAKYLHIAVIYALILYPWTTFFFGNAFDDMPMFVFIFTHVSLPISFICARSYFQCNHLSNFIVETFIPIHPEQQQTEYMRLTNKPSQQQTKEKVSRSINANHSEWLKSIERDHDLSQLLYREESHNPLYTTNKTYEEPISSIHGLTTTTTTAIDTSLTKHKSVIKDILNDNDKQQQQQQKQKQKQQQEEEEEIVSPTSSEKPSGLCFEDMTIDKNSRTDGFFSKLYYQQKRNKANIPRNNNNNNNDNDNDNTGIDRWSEKYLSLALFKTNIDKLYRRFFALAAITTIPILVINILEQTVFYSYMAAPYQNVSQHIKYIFHIVDAVLTSSRLLFSVTSFVFLCVFFQFIIECHRGDLLRHIRMYDTLWNYVSDEDNNEVNGENYINKTNRYQQIATHLAKIVADWDRITSSVRQTSKNFRWWIVVMVVLNFVAACISILSMAGRPDIVLRHMDVYLQSCISALTTFYILLAATKISHMNARVNRRLYGLLAVTHFNSLEDLTIPNEIIQSEEELSSTQLKQVKICLQAQAVQAAIQSKYVGISIYGLVLNRNLFLAVLSPFVAFLLFVVNYITHF